MYTGDYVELLDILGVITKVIPCITGNGAPSPEEGVTGCLYLDTTTGLMYKCVAKNESSAVWEPMATGMSIISAKTTGNGALEASFLYDNLLTPDYYSMKIGDLILDSAGYLYQINAIYDTQCDAKYCGTQIGSNANGNYNRTLNFINGRLQLLNEAQDVVSEVDITPDCIKTVGGTTAYLFVGTKDYYKEISLTLSENVKNNLIAFITDDTSKEDIQNAIEKIKQWQTQVVGGYVTVQNANFASMARQDGNKNVIHETYAKKTIEEPTIEQTNANGFNVIKGSGYYYFDYYDGIEPPLSLGVLYWGGETTIAEMRVMMRDNDRDLWVSEQGVVCVGARGTAVLEISKYVRAKKLFNGGNGQ